MKERYAIVAKLQQRLINQILQRKNKEGEHMKKNVQAVNKTFALITKLQKGTITERKIAHSLKKYSEYRSFGYKEYQKRAKIEKSLYRLFLKSIKPEQAIQLNEIDKRLNQVISTFQNNTGWHVSRHCVEKRDNYTNQADPEFETHDTYTIRRNAEGFYISENVAFNGYDARIQETEINFYLSHKSTLELIHELLSLKERIMLGDFETKNDKIDRDYLIAIADFLGYRITDTKLYQKTK